MGRPVRLLLPLALSVMLSTSAVGAAEPATRPAADGWRVISGAWERPAANGHYVVRLTTTDGAKVKDLADLDVEGVPLLAGASAMNRLAGSISILAHVTDDRLTIANAVPQADRIAEIEVRQAYAPQRIVSWQTIGWSSTEPADRHVGWGIKQSGWAGFVKRVVEPEIRWGVRRIALSNPFGCLAGEDMQFDQYLHAREAKLRWLTDGFVEAWKPVTARGVEVICYLGTMGSDADFTGPAKANPEAGWQTRFWASVQPALDAGMSVAFDASAVQPAGSTTHRAVRLLQERGIKVYIEARPQRDLPHWHDFPVICIDWFWHQSDPAKSPAAVPWAARNEQLTGEIIRVVTEPPKGKKWTDRGWLEPYARRILADGHTAAIGVDQLIQEGVPLLQLLTRLQRP